MIVFKRLYPVKVISFDLDDTLYDNVPVMKRAEEEFARYLCERYALPQSASEPAFWHEAKDRLAAADPELYNDVTFLRALGLMQTFKELGRPLPGGLNEAGALVREFVRIRSSFEVPQSSKELLLKLRERYIVCAVSNGNSDLNLNDLHSYFDHDLRPQRPFPRRKPYSDLFDNLGQLTGAKPTEILHVGDEPLSDLRGAVLAGVQCAVLYKGYAGLSSGFESFLQVPHLLLHSLDELLMLRL